MKDILDLWPLISALLVLLWRVVLHEFQQSKQIRVLEKTVEKFQDFEKIEARLKELETENKLLYLKAAEHGIILNQLNKDEKST